MDVRYARRAGVAGIWERARQQMADRPIGALWQQGEAPDKRALDVIAGPHTHHGHIDVYLTAGIASQAHFRRRALVGRNS